MTVDVDALPGTVFRRRRDRQPAPRRFRLRPPFEIEQDEQKLGRRAKVLLRYPQRGEWQILKMYVEFELIRRFALVDDDGLLEVAWKQLQEINHPIHRGGFHDESDL